LLADELGVTALNCCHGTVNHIVNNPFGRLLVVDNGSGFAHEERSGVIQSIVIDIVAQVLHVILDGNLSASGERLDFLRTVFFPVLDVWVGAHTQRTSLYHD
jgi:hypothetical protein